MADLRLLGLVALFRPDEGKVVPFQNRPKVSFILADEARFLLHNPVFGDCRRSRNRNVPLVGNRNHPDPAYREHFAVGDVPAGEYVVGTTIDGRKVFKRIRVEAGKVTWVEFR